MSAKKTAKKVGIWASVVIAILSAFGIPIRPEVISVIEVYKQTVEQIEDVETETEINP